MKVHDCRDPETRITDHNPLRDTSLGQGSHFSAQGLQIGIKGVT